MSNVVDINRLLNRTSFLQKPIIITLVKQNTLIFLMVAVSMSNCKQKPDSKGKNYSSGTSNSIKNEEQLVNSECEKRIIFIEENFPKYTSCDDIKIKYSDNTIEFTQKSTTHEFKISDVQDIYSYPLLGIGGNCDNLFISETSIMERGEMLISRYDSSYYIIEDDNPVRKKHKEWSDKERKRLFDDDKDNWGNWYVPIENSKFDPKRKNPYENQLRSLIRQKYNSVITRNRTKYNKMTILDYTKKQNRISQDILRGKEEDNYVQIAFNNSLIKFEIYDNLNYDEKYDEKALDAINTCLQCLVYLKSQKLADIIKENDAIEKLRTDSLKRIKLIE